MPRDLGRATLADQPGVQRKVSQFAPRYERVTDATRVRAILGLVGLAWCRWDVLLVRQIKGEIRQVWGSARAGSVFECGFTQHGSWR